MIIIRKAINKAYKYIRYFIYGISNYFKILFSNRNNSIFLLQTPMHGNVGDQAIAFAENEFLSNIYPNKHIYEIQDIYLETFVWPWKLAIGNSPILIHGGGFIGSLWRDEDYTTQKILKAFKKNKIIIMPQTFYYDSLNDELFNSEHNTMMRCNNLTIFARENNTYNLLDNEFRSIPHYLVPDIVLYSDKLINKTKKNNSNTAIVCLRNDNEKDRNNGLKEIINEIANKTNYLIEYTDTVQNVLVFPWQRYKFVKDKIDYFHKADFVITDRLHGMILSILAGTPCFVIDNKSHKISGVYQWLKGLQGIKFISEYSSIIENLNVITNHVEYSNYHENHLKPKFEILEDKIKSMYK